MRKLTDNARTSSGLSQWYPLTLANVTPVAKTADYTVLPTEMGSIFTNAAASGTVVFTLPSAALVPNKTVRFAVLAAQILRVDPAGTEKAYLDGSGVAGKYVNLSAVIGGMVDMFSDGTDWLVTASRGIVTKEA